MAAYTLCKSARSTRRRDLGDYLLGVVKPWYFRLLDEKITADRTHNSVGQAGLGTRRANTRHNFFGVSRRFCFFIRAVFTPRARDVRLVAVTRAGGLKPRMRYLVMPERVYNRRLKRYLSANRTPFGIRKSRFGTACKLAVNNCFVVLRFSYIAAQVTIRVAAVIIFMPTRWLGGLLRGCFCRCICGQRSCIFRRGIRRYLCGSICGLLRRSIRRRFRWNISRCFCWSFCWSVCGGFSRSVRRRFCWSDCGCFCWSIRRCLCRSICGRFCWNIRRCFCWSVCRQRSCIFRWSIRRRFCWSVCRQRSCIFRWSVRRRLCRSIRRCLCRSICGLLRRSICRRFCWSVCRRFCWSVGGRFCWNVCGLYCWSIRRCFCWSISRCFCWSVCRQRSCIFRWSVCW